MKLFLGLWQCSLPVHPITKSCVFFYTMVSWVCLDQLESIHVHCFLWEFQQRLAIESLLTDALAIHDSGPREARDLLNFLAVLSPLPSDTFNDGVYLFLSGPIRHTCPASSCAPLRPDPYPESVHLRSMSCQRLLLWGFYTCYLLSWNILSPSSFGLYP